MGANYWQCQVCGKIHRANVRLDIDELYTTIECPNCRGGTKHLWVGDREEDKYIYYDNTLDERFYQYKTK